MLVKHESNYGREYQLKVVLTTLDMEGIAQKMQTNCEAIDGSTIAHFVRGVLAEVIANSLRDSPVVLR